MKVLGIIPARYASTRFPGKPLVEIQGKTMIQRVYEQAKKACSLERVVVATDDERIFSHVKSFGGEVVMTAATHQSGTDRCEEVIVKETEQFDIAVNIQGDEPFIQPGQIDLLTSVFSNRPARIATLVKKIANVEELKNINSPKVVINLHGEAVYFSRTPIPFNRNIPIEQWLLHQNYYKHIGMYAYNTGTLREITQLPLSALERTEALEQLRWIENGYKIHVEITDTETIAIDTPEDLNKLQKLT